MDKKAIVLTNLGTPNSPKVRDVRKYLKEFLGDGRVIDIPAIPRFLLVNGIIAPFRAPKSAREYEKIWSEKGSPIIYYGKSLRDKVQQLTSDDVYLAMRYQNPSLKGILAEIYRKKYNEVVIVPLFPQYASSTVGSIAELASQLFAKWNYYPKLKILNQFYNDSGYIESFAKNIAGMYPESFDHVLFSYHGLPIRHVNRTHEGKTCEEAGCMNGINEENKFCYRAQCYETTKLIASRLGLSRDNHTTCFQSRFSKDWLEPFTDNVIIEKAKLGNKNLLVTSPAFVADCLETIAEIGIGYDELFKENGGKQLTLVPSLNDGDGWVKAILKIFHDI